MRFLLFVFIVLLTGSGVRSQDELPPYIHYFDHLHGGLVIERADGTDSRIIRGVPQAEPIWSPSGKWMVVGNVIVRTDGGDRIALPEPTGVYDSIHALWAADDMLLVVRDEQATATGYARVIDPERGT